MWYTLFDLNAMGQTVRIDDGLMGDASARAVIVAYCVKQCNKLSRVHYSMVVEMVNKHSTTPGFDKKLTNRF